MADRSLWMSGVGKLKNNCHYVQSSCCHSTVSSVKIVRLWIVRLLILNLSIVRFAIGFQITGNNKLTKQTNTKKILQDRMASEATPTPNNQEAAPPTPGRGSRNNYQGGRGRGRGGRGRQSTTERGTNAPQGRGPVGPATSGVPYGHVPGYLPGSSSLVEELDKRVLIVLRDGRHLVGVSIHV